MSTMYFLAFLVLAGVYDAVDKQKQALLWTGAALVAVLLPLIFPELK